MFRVAVFFGEAETLGEMRADLSAVKHSEWRPRRFSSDCSAVAIVDLPAPDRPVNQTTNPWLKLLLRGSPQRSLIDRSRAPNKLSIRTPMTKITTSKRAGCCASELFFAD